MEKKNFWNEAAKYGVIMALVAILFDVLGFYVQNTLLSLLSLVIFVLLLGYFTKRRAERFGARGYGYGQCLGICHRHVCSSAPLFYPDAHHQ